MGAKKKKCWFRGCENKHTLWYGCLIESIDRENTCATTATLHHHRRDLSRLTEVEILKYSSEEFDSLYLQICSKCTAISRSPSRSERSAEGEGVVGSGRGRHGSA